MRMQCTQGHNTHVTSTYVPWPTAWHTLPMQVAVKLPHVVSIRWFLNTCSLEVECAVAHTNAEQLLCTLSSSPLHISNTTLTSSAAMAAILPALQLAQWRS